MTDSSQAPKAPPASLAVAIVWVSASLLMFEILQTITLSLQTFHQTAFLVVSFGMCGIGGGATLASVFEERVDDPLRWLWGSALAFSGSVVLSAMVASRVQDLVPLILACLPPYVFAGFFLAVLFREWPDRVGTHYFWNLAGSGLGCVGLLLVLEGTDQASTTLVVTAGIGAAGALLLARTKTELGGTVALFLGIAALLPLGSSWVPFQPNPSKSYGVLLNTPGIASTLDWSEWGFLGRVDHVVPGEGIEKALYGAEAKALIDAGGDYRYLFASGGNWSYTLNFRESNALRAQFLRESVLTAPYVGAAPKRVLNIGVGGGVDVFTALQHGATDVTGVEINALMLDGARIGGPWDGALDDPRVDLVLMDGRTFVNQTSERYDLLTLSAVDTDAGLAGSANMLSENYLYTQEAFDQYIDVLEPDGAIFVFRPPNQLVRTIVTAVGSLERRGVTNLHHHVMIFGRDDWTAALIGKQPLSQQRVAALAERLGRGELGGQTYYVAYDGAIPAGQGGREDVRALFGDLMAAVRAGETERFVRDAELDYGPVTDDSPYFYQHDRALLSSPAGQVLLLALVVVSALATVLVVLPLIGRTSVERRRGFLPTAAYFGAIGLGFMFVEICLIQKLVLYLGHPSYSVSVTLFAMLVFSGIGSLVSGSITFDTRASRIALFGGILLAIGGYAIVLGPMLGALPVANLAGRCAIVVALLAPGSVLLGMPFPTCIRTLSGPDASFIPWACAINTFGSVAGSVLAVLTAMAWGFTACLAIGALCYAVALGADLVVRSRREAQPA